MGSTQRSLQSNFHFHSQTLNLLAAKIEGQGDNNIMTANVQGSNILDVLKKKMRATKEESEKFKEECEDVQRKLQVEIMRREEAEGEVAALNRRIQLLEEDLERSEERLATATQKLAEASHAADESERIRKVLENKNNMEADLERAEERAETGESKIVELEEELRVVGNNLK